MPALPPRRVVTVGDPGSIGPEIARAALAGVPAARRASLLLVAPGRPDESLDPTVFRPLDLPRSALPRGASTASFDDPGLPESVVREAEAWRRAGVFAPRGPDDPIPVLSPAAWRRARFPSGRWTPASGRASADAVALAVALCLIDSDGGLPHADALVTGPIAKAAWAAGGVAFPGHTEFIAWLCGVPGREVMLLEGGGLRVALATVHEPLARVPALLDTDGLVRVARTVAEAMARDFGRARAKLAILGLNPHAGEEGRLGDEEIRIIAPAVQRLRALGVDAIGPLPADSTFHQARRGDYDAIIAMYHDQGLGPLKTVGFERGINMTLGLPLIRTSVDHGTAFSLAGRGVASSRSMEAALRAAAAMARRRRAFDRRENGKKVNG